MSIALDIERYDRQIRTYGIVASQKINNSSVCVIGCGGGLGTEICKNLSLCGIKNIFLYDEEDINNFDTVTGYYFDENDIGQKRSLILKDKLLELNPSVNINIINEKELLNDNINVYITINRNESEIIKYNLLARKNNSKFISLNSNNFKGDIFVDAGEEHIINEVSSENYESIQILNITNDGIIHTHGHEYQTGDLIKLNNFEGKNIEIFLNKTWEIIVINRFAFKLKDFQFINNDFQFINGISNYVQKQIIINSKTFDKVEKPLSFTYSNDNLKEYIPVVSIMGSLAASEAMKLISNKFMPVNQWFSWYDEYLNSLVFDNIIKEKIEQSKWLLVGSGAIGCELLKNLAWLNVDTIKITDPDTIEKSNLSRQFLFRADDIGKLKSEVASNKILKSKKNIKIEYYSEKVDWENKKFTDKILCNSELTGVFNALDNISARKFMDEQCFNYDKPLFESGTLGTKGNTQPIIPFVTETYSNTNDPPQEKSFPVCTIKNFPNQIHHTIHWALDQFEFFNRGPRNLELWNKNKMIDFPNTAEGSQMNNDIYLFSNKYKPQIWQDCMCWAFDMFYENFNKQIKQLLHNFPEDMITKEGTLFWSSGKRCPKPIYFEINNPLHIDYIYSTINLLCNALCMNTNFTTAELKFFIMQRYDKLVIENNNTFSPNKVFIPSNDTEIEKDIGKINLQVLNTDYKVSNIIPQVLDKDNDNNYHIKWITATSNLRATNYGIQNEDFYTTKGIAGKIIPAISTTTSIISGLIVLEMIKYLVTDDTNDTNDKNIDKYKSTFLNLADNMLISAEPIKAPMINIGSQKVNSWYKFKYNIDSTLETFKKYYEDIFKSTITMIAYNCTLLYSDFTDNSNLLKKFSEIEDLNKESQLELTLLFENDTIEIPPIIVNYTQ
jgi:ubiquitin-activating enzyme E1